MDASLATLEDGEEGLLRNLHPPDLLHALLPLLLLLEELLLPRDVAAVALRGDVLPHRLHGLARDHLGADGGLDRDLEHLARDQAAEALAEVTPPEIRTVAVDDAREGVDRIAVDQDVE